MVDHEIVCSMCGDVGFTDKLFRCNKCRYRFQHSYCSNFYREQSEVEECDWCQSKGKSSAGSKKQTMKVTMNRNSGEKILKQHREEKRKSPLPSPRQTATRRYKLLKDVMC